MKPVCDFGYFRGSEFRNGTFLFPSSWTSPAVCESEAQHDAGACLRLYSKPLDAIVVGVL